VPRFSVRPHPQATGHGTTGMARCTVQPVRMPWPTGRRWFAFLVIVWVAALALVGAVGGRFWLIAAILTVGVWGQVVVYEWDVHRRGPKPYRPPWRR
jgi:hypothetical protein